MLKNKLFTAVLVFSFAIAPFAHGDAVSDLQAQINEILTRIKTLQTQLNNAQGGSSSAVGSSSSAGSTGTAGSSEPFEGQGFCRTFTHPQVVGSRGEDVDALITVLVKEGFISNPLNERIFGEDFTEDVATAVIDFQTKYGIQKTGTVGPKTRAKLNSLYGCGLIKQPVNTSVTTQDAVTAPANAVSNAKPTITSISSNSAPADGKTQVTITGSGFRSDSVIGLGNGIPVSPISQTSNTLKFTIPTWFSPTTNALISVSNSQSSAGPSNAMNFSITAPVTTSIQPTITILSPNGGDSLRIGSTYKITWKDTREKGVTPTYVVSKLGGDGKEEIRGGSVACTSGTCSMDWTIPGHISASTNNQIAIYDVANDPGGNIVGRSGFFTITAPANAVSNAKPTIASVNPSSAPADGKTQVTITGSGFGSDSVIGLGNGIPIYPISQYTTSNTLVFTVPTWFSPKAGYVVSVSGTQSNLGPSNTVSFIVTAPAVEPTVDLRINGSQGPVTLSSGTPITLSWSSTDTNRCEGVSANGATHGTYQTVADQNVPSYLIRCFSATGKETSKIVYVTVTAASAPSSITVLAPASGETLTTGSPYKISWKDTRSGGTTAKYIIKMSGSNGTWTLFDGVSGTVCSGGMCSINWSPDSASTNNQISVYDVANDSGAKIVGLSGYFSVKTATTPPPPAGQLQGTLLLTSLRNGSETWVGGQSYNITWTATNFSSSDKVDLVLYQGSNYVLTVAKEISANSGSYQWTVPKTLSSGNYTLRVSSATVYSIYDDSDNSVYVPLITSSAETVSQMASVLESVRATLEGIKASLGR